MRLRITSFPSFPRVAEAPITAIIIVFELTYDYEIILPLMITSIVSLIVSSYLSRESIYTLKLLLRGISIKEGTETNVMESIIVKNVYNKEYKPSKIKFDTVNIKQDLGIEIPIFIVNKIVAACLCRYFYGKRQAGSHGAAKP